MSNASYKIESSVEIRGKRFNANELVIQSSVNGGTSITATGIFAEDSRGRDSITLPVSQFAEEAAEVQNYILGTAKTDPDVKVSLKAVPIDAAENEATFSEFWGYLSAPNFGVTGSTVSRSFSASGLDQQLAMFVGSIYAPTWNRGPAVLKDVKVDSASFAGVLLGVLEWLMAEFTTYRTGDNASEVDRALALPTHERNKTLMPYIRAALNGSSELTLYPELKGSIQSAGGKQTLETNLTAALVNCVVSQPNLLIGLSGSFVGTFPCVFVPSFGKDPFKLKLLETVNEAGDTLTTTPEGLAFNAGSSYNLPLKGVIITTAEASAPLTEAPNEFRMLEKIAAIYPEGVSNAAVLAGAAFQKIGAPTWIPRVYAGVFATGMDAMRDIVEKKLDATTASFRNKQAQALFTTKSKDTQLLLKRYAKSQYLYLALAGSRATFNLPLNLSVQLGTCYEIRQKDDTLLTGFVQSITHRVRSDGGGNASTTVMLSHLRMPGFELPVN